MAKRKEDPILEQTHSKADDLLVALFADLHQAALHLSNPNLRGAVPSLAHRLKGYWTSIKEYVEAKGIYSEKEMRGEKKEVTQ